MGKRRNDAADPKQRTKTISMKLSFILRHGAQKIGLSIRSDGFVSVRELLGLKELKAFSPSVDELKGIVRDCAKQRFEMVEIDSELMIRAVQGHSIASIDASELLTELTLDEVIVSDEYSVVVHGTRRELLDSIMTGSGANATGSAAAGMAAGLSRCSRNHVHLSLGFPVGFEVSSWRSVWGEYASHDAAIATACTAGNKRSAPESMSIFRSDVGHTGLVSQARVRALVVNGTDDVGAVSAMGDNEGAAGRTVPIALSGIRYSTTAILFIDIRRALADGVRFFRSSNNVILTPGLGDSGVLPAQYVCDIITLSDNKLKSSMSQF